MRREEAAATRRRVFAVLASAPEDMLVKLWRESGLPDEATLLRGPETGLVALRGRIGGGGSPFNFGEATVTRASVKLPSGEIGHAYALGREREKVRISAIVDALHQKPEFASEVDRKILEPLDSELRERDEKRRAEIAATRVEFFTMTRGED